MATLTDKQIIDIAKQKIKIKKDYNLFYLSYFHNFYYIINYLICLLSFS